MSSHLATLHPEEVTGIHINMVIAGPGGDSEDLTESEQAALALLNYYDEWDSGYSKQQSTRPQTLGYSLVDSPSANAAGSSRSSGAGPTPTAIPLPRSAPTGSWTT